MADRSRMALTLQADEIDHLTIRYTDFGESLDKKRAVKMIKFYCSAYREAAENLADIPLFEGELMEKDEKELYEILVKIRTVLLDMAFEK